MSFLSNKNIRLHKMKRANKQFIYIYVCNINVNNIRVDTYIRLY